MDAEFSSRRLNDLADHIDRDWGLLKEYELNSWIVSFR